MNILIESFRTNASPINSIGIRIRKIWWPLLVVLPAFLLMGALSSVSAAQVDIPGPPGSIEFGANVTVLPNGNFVVIDPEGPGAVYLYSPDGVLISTLSGGQPSDEIGIRGITVLGTGHFVVSSPNWRSGMEFGAGAVTWVNADTGLNGVVSASNSLVGSTGGDRVGGGDVTALSNGNYVVSAPNWDNGVTEDVGAVTWANGSTGLSGVVSPANSLVGSTTDDQVGDNGITALSNGNYVVGSASWSNGALESAGAATWANGNTGLVGEVSSLNSLIGGSANDQVSTSDIIALSNGNYVVGSDSWNNGAAESAGAATWGDGNTGTIGVVSVVNSIVGTSTDDNVGERINALSNGNYVVRSYEWNNGAATQAGAVTWGDGSSGTSGEVSAANSLVGSTTNDQIGRGEIVALSNGNYVVASPNWDSGSVADAGAATWGDGAAGVSGVVSIVNSLVGSEAEDVVGSGRVIALDNGHYVVSSPSWDNGPTANVGAVTWGNGNTGSTGAVSTGNSLIGSQVGDQVGSSTPRALANGNYVVPSQTWRNGAAATAGAVTWANGDIGLVGVVSSANSLVGSTAADQVGSGVTTLANGHYVVSSPFWNNGASPNVGAVTWANGAVGLSGPVSLANSLVGQSNNDEIGAGDHVALGDGNYILYSERWNNGALSDAGAVTFGPGSQPLLGTIDASNSVLGGVANAGGTMVFDYDEARQQIVVGRPAENIVSLFTLRPTLIFANGFD